SSLSRRYSGHSSSCSCRSSPRLDIIVGNEDDRCEHYCMKSAWMAVFLLGGTFVLAQSTSATFPPAVSVKQLMLDLIHPSSNDILLLIYRGGPKDEKDWAAVRRSAVALAESGNMLMMWGRARDQVDWMKDAKLLADAGNAAYKAAQAKDGNA